MSYTVDEFVSYISQKYPQYNPQLRTKESIYELGKQLEPNIEVQPFYNKTKPTHKSASFFPNPDRANTSISPNTFQMHMKNMEVLTNDLQKRIFDYTHPEIKKEASDYFVNNLSGRVGVQQEGLETIGSVTKGPSIEAITSSAEHNKFVQDRFDDAWESAKKNPQNRLSLNILGKMSNAMNTLGAIALDGSWSAASLGGIDSNSLNSAKYGYNESLEGLFYELVYGEKKFEYSVENYDPEWYEQVHGGLVGLTTPLSLLSMVGGGILAKGITSTVIRKKGAEELTKNIVSQGGFRNLLSKGLETRFIVSDLNRKMVNKIPIKMVQKYSDEIADAALSSSINMASQFAVLEAAHGNLGTRVQLNKSYDTMDQDLRTYIMKEYDWDGFSPISEEMKSKVVSSQTIKSAIHGAMLGGIAGYGGGAIGGYYQSIGNVLRLKKSAGIKLTSGELKLLQRAEGSLPTLGKMGYEIGVFTSPTIKDEWEGLKSGQAESFEKVFTAALVNAGMVGVMNGTQGMLNKGKSSLRSWQNKFKEDMHYRMTEGERLNAIQKKLEFEVENSTGAAKEAFKISLEEIKAERSKIKQEFESNNGNVEKIKNDLESNIRELSNLSSDKSPGALNRQIQQISKAIQTLNEYIGLTGDKEMASLLNKFEADVMSGLKGQMGGTIKTKAELIELYKTVKKSRGGDTEIILVERDGKPVSLNLKKDISKITSKDIIDAINLENKASNKAAADLAISSIEKNNKIRDYNSTEDFTRGYVLDSKGNPIPVSNKKTNNVRNKGDSSNFSKRKSRNEELNRRAKDLADTHEKIINDGGGSAMSYEQRSAWAQSKSIILNAIERFYLDKVDVSLGGAKNYRPINMVKNQIKTLNEFAKFLASKEKNLLQANNKDFIEFLRENGNINKAKALKEFFESNKKSLIAKDIKFDAFEKYSLMRPKPVTTRIETDTRGLEKVLSSKFNFKIEEIRDLREMFTGFRRFKDMPPSKQLALQKQLNKFLSRNWEGRTPEIRGAEMRIRISQEKNKLNNKNISDILQEFGVKDGKFKNVRNVETLKEVESFLSEKLAVTEKNTIINSLEISELDIANKGYFPSVIKRFISLVPAAFNVKKYVSKKIYQALTGSDLMQERIAGMGEAHMSQIKEILPNKSDRKMLRFIDKEMRREAKTDKELQFIKDLEKTGEVIVDGKKISVDSEFIPFDAVIKGGSTAWQAKMHHKRFLNRIFEMQLDAMYSTSKNKKHFYKVRQTLEKRFLENYMTRVINPKIKQILVTKYGTDQKWFKDFAEKILYENARESALNKGFKKGSDQYKNHIKEYVQKTSNKGEATNQVYNFFYSGINSINPKFLSRRVGLLGDKDGYITYKNRFGITRKIKAYSSNYDAIMQTYYRGMGQSIAVSTYFPELHPLAKGNKGVMTTEKLTKVLGQINPAGRDYTVRLIKKNFGLEHRGMYDLRTLQKFVGTVGTGIVMAGLSIPVLPGLKNFAIGQARNVGAYGVVNTLIGIGSVLSAKERKLARERGYLQQGIQSLEFTKKDAYKYNPFTLDKMFTYWNLMKPTEFINRISSNVASRITFETQLRQYKGTKTILGTDLKQNNMIREIWRERFKFTEAEIAFIERNSLETLLNKESKGVDYLHDKVASQGHISTQGSTNPNVLPMWMSSIAARPLTIFYRIASHATFDTYINFIKPAVKYQNAYPLMRLAIAHQLTGSALNWAYKEILGKENPFDAFDESKMDEKEKFNNQMGKVFYDVNASGLFGVVDWGTNYIPYLKNVSTITPMSPSLINIGESLASNVSQLFFQRPGNYSGAEWGADRFANFIKEATAAGSQYDKQVDRLWDKNEFVIKRTKFRKLFNTWLASNRTKKQFKDFDFKPMSYMMLEVKEVFTKPGSTQKEKEVALMSVYNALVHEEMTVNGIYGLEAHKKAVKRIKLSMNHLRPITTKLGGEENKLNENDLVEFYKSLKPELQKELQAIDEEFLEIDKLLENMLGSKSLMRRYSILGHVSNMQDIDTAPHHKAFHDDFYNSLDDEDKALYNRYRVFY